jgi:eukaryotic-like serine/threonine-protein kinase
MSPLLIALAVLSAAPAKKPARDAGAPDAGASAAAAAMPDAGAAQAAEPGKATLTAVWSESPHRGPILAVAFSRDGMKVATGAGDRVARVFDAASGKLLYELQGASTPVVALAFSPDGKRLATGENALVARLYALDTGKLEKELPHPDKVSGLAFSPDGTLLAVAGNTGTGQVYRVPDGAKAWEFSGRSVAFSADGKWLASAVPAGALRLWDAVKGRMKSEANTAPHQPWLTASADLGLAGTWNPSEKSARLWELRAGKAAGELKGHEKGVSSAALTLDGKYLATASEDLTLRLWDVPGRRFLGHTMLDQIAFIAFSSDGQRLAVGQGNRISVYAIAW